MDDRDTSTTRPLPRGGHRYGVAHVAFSSTRGERLVSLGDDHDAHVCLWDWRDGELLAKHRPADPGPLRAAAFIGGDGASFLTAGAAHLTCWTVTNLGEASTSGMSGGGGPGSSGLSPASSGSSKDLGVTGRAVIMGGHASSEWVAVVAAVAIQRAGAPPPSSGDDLLVAPPPSPSKGDRTPAGLSPRASSNLRAPRGTEAGVSYALSSAGVLCMLRTTSGRATTVERWVDARVKAGTALASSAPRVAVAAARGLVRLFAAATLAYEGTLPRPAPRGMHGETSTSAATSAGVRFPAATACAFDTAGSTLAVAYADRSLFLWDTTNPTKGVRRLRSFLAHSGAVWGVAPLPWGPTGEGGQPSVAPPGTFVTAGADGSARLWHLGWEGRGDPGGEPGLPLTEGPSSRGDRPRPVHSRETVAVLYAGLDVKRVGTEKEGVPTEVPTSGSSGEPPDAPFSFSEEINEDAARAGAAGYALRCIAARPDGREIAVGDKAGNVRVFDLATRSEVARLHAHDAEVLSLSYGPQGIAAAGSSATGGEQRLVSGGRDRLIHVYDATARGVAGEAEGARGVCYALEETLDDHSGAVTAVKVAGVGHRARLLSAGADASVVFRQLKALKRTKTPVNDAGEVEGVTAAQVGGHDASDAPKRTLRYHREVMPRGTVHGLDVDAAERYCVTVGADRRLRVWSVATGRGVRAYPAEEGAGEALAVKMDPSGGLAAVAHADRAVRVYDVKTGELVARARGHGEAATALAFTQDCGRLITGGGDGCVCVWRLPAQRAAAARRKLTSAGRIPAEATTPATPKAAETTEKTTQNLDDATPPCTPHADQDRRVAWIPDGRPSTVRHLKQRLAAARPTEKEKQTRGDGDGNHSPPSGEARAAPRPRVCSPEASSSDAHSPVTSAVWGGKPPTDDADVLLESVDVLLSASAPSSFVPGALPRWAVAAMAPKDGDALDAGSVPRDADASSEGGPSSAVGAAWASSELPRTGVASTPLEGVRRHLGERFDTAAADEAAMVSSPTPLPGLGCVLLDCDDDDDLALRFTAAEPGKEATGEAFGVVTVCDHQEPELAVRIPAEAAEGEETTPRGWDRALLNDDDGTVSVSRTPRDSAGWRRVASPSPGSEPIRSDSPCTLHGAPPGAKPKGKGAFKPPKVKLVRSFTDSGDPGAPSPTLTDATEPDDESDDEPVVPLALRFEDDEPKGGEGNDDDAAAADDDAAAVRLSFSGRHRRSAPVAEGPTEEDPRGAEPLVASPRPGGEHALTVERENAMRLAATAGIFAGARSSAPRGSGSVDSVAAGIEELRRSISSLGTEDELKGETRTKTNTKTKRTPRNHPGGFLDAPPARDPVEAASPKTPKASTSPGDEETVPVCLVSSWEPDSSVRIPAEAATSIAEIVDAAEPRSEAPAMAKEDADAVVEADHRGSAGRVLSTPIAAASVADVASHPRPCPFPAGWAPPPAGTPPDGAVPERADDSARKSSGDAPAGLAGWAARRARARRHVDGHVDGRPSSPDTAAALTSWHGRRSRARRALIAIAERSRATSAGAKKEKHITAVATDPTLEGELTATAEFLPLPHDAGPQHTDANATAAGFEPATGPTDADEGHDATRSVPTPRPEPSPPAGSPASGDAAGEGRNTDSNAVCSDALDALEAAVRAAVAARAAVVGVHPAVDRRLLAVADTIAKSVAVASASATSDAAAEAETAAADSNPGPAASESEGGGEEGGDGRVYRVSDLTGLRQLLPSPSPSPMRPFSARREVRAETDAMVSAAADGALDVERVVSDAMDRALSRYSEKLIAVLRSSVHPVHSFQMHAATGDVNDVGRQGDV